ncbi:hypothetical protein Q7C36_023628 [Tachysurus vachellii]|uniref:Uncharacterized protein n=1 Tax=Tachysurus vachellii TaxID=175792 RepID=A0AA88IYY5_TACVA|nr:hypothetical protein Q7C36_023628 [Tachysurus vachellii]
MHNTAAVSEQATERALLCSTGTIQNHHRPTTDAPNVQKMSKCPGYKLPNAKETAVRWVRSTSRPAPSTSRGSTDGLAAAIKPHYTFTGVNSNSLTHSPGM